MNEKTPGVNEPSSKWLTRMFCALVLALAFFQFSENTADPDLWAHAMFGEQNIVSRRIEGTEIYSWTAKGLPFVNHEVLAETVIGASHMIAGGSGILALKMLMGFLAFGIALRMGGEGMAWPQRLVAWAVGGIAVVEISYGFPPRPQIFTAVSLATELWLLRKIHQGKLWWALGLPVLFALWINFHGGALAGLGLLVVTAVTSTGQFLWNKFAGARAQLLNAMPVSKNVLLVLWLVPVACGAALLANPWGFGLVKWIAVAVLWPRPEIEEWNPASLGWNHAIFFILMLLVVVAFGLTRRKRNLWEFAVCAALAYQAIHVVRHTPLFCIAALAFIPPHLADVIAQFREHFGRIEELFARAAVRTGLCVVMGGLAFCVMISAFTLHKEHPFTMEVPRSQYPVGAVEFIRRNELRGNILMFFDWGEMCLWELPDCPVSMDGRMDACYPHDLILEHWNVYNDLPVNSKILDVSQADMALLPQKLTGALALSKQPGWQAVYVDDVAVVLLRDVARFPKLVAGQPPVQGGADATTGRARFPDALPAHVARLKISGTSK